MKTTAQIRQAFLDFFTQREHRLVASADLVPQDDPTLLFTTAGMVPFKRFYDGTVEVPNRRTTSCQKCLRVKGKASDLENVGRTVRHMTFFEMLGNFSFGDYFKREAIRWAWEFSTEVMGLDGERIWVTIFEEDDEAGDLWVSEVDFPRERIVKMGRKDNFWGPAGETGACGPCSELHFDRGPEFGEGDPSTNDQRFLEFWNLVFPQYDYQADDPKRPLKNRGIDTGMGLERLAMLAQDVPSIFDTDGLRPACEHLATLLDRDLDTISETERHAINACVDHARCLTFAISEGIIPSNEGRGYVMRSIIRRAIRLYKTALHHSQPVLHELVEDYLAALGDVYPQIREGVDHTKQVIRHEEERFLRTVDKGEDLLQSDIVKQEAKIVLLSDAINQLERLLALSDQKYRLVREDEYGSKSDREGLVGFFADALFEGSSFIEEYAVDPESLAAAKEVSDYTNEHVVDWITEGDLDTVRKHGCALLEKAHLLKRHLLLYPGNRVFFLYDTHGFPMELCKEILEDRGIALDTLGFHKSMEQQRAKARASWKGAELAESEKVYNTVAEQHGETEFLGYESTEGHGDIITLMRNNALVDKLEDGQEGEVLLTSTPFYAESGGQVGDIGTLAHGDAIFVVTDTQKTTHGLYRHLGKVKAGRLQKGQVVKASVNAERRLAIRRHHSATHLLNAALRKHLGTHVKQAGSLVNDEHLRFDFTHSGSLDADTLAGIERTVADQVMANHAVETQVMPIEEAKKTGAVAVFGEKYGDVVRVVTMGPLSTEFCGGTHLNRTGEVGAFVVAGESSIAAGTRRIEAYAGEAAVAHLQAMRQREQRLSHALSVKPDALEERFVGMQDEIKSLRREIGHLRQELSAAQLGGGGGAKAGTEVKGITVIAQRIEAANAGDLRNAADVARAGKTKTVAVLGAAINGKASIIVAVTDDLKGRLPAGKVVNEVAAIVGGKGGGKPDLAQAGGKDVEKIDEAIAKAPEIIAALLA